MALPPPSPCETWATRRQLISRAHWIEPTPTDTARVRGLGVGQQTANQARARGSNTLAAAACTRPPASMEGNYRCARGRRIVRGPLFRVSCWMPPDTDTPERRRFEAPEAERAARCHAPPISPICSTLDADARAPYATCGQHRCWPGCAPAVKIRLRAYRGARCACCWTPCRHAPNIANLLACLVAGVRKDGLDLRRCWPT